jgi:hypothetical protein
VWVCNSLPLLPFQRCSDLAFRIVEFASPLIIRIVEFASQEDSQRAIRELSEQALLGRPVFIREVRANILSRFILDFDLFVNE